jgi:threonine/homoserine/homoserine lactone efflux protein
MLSTLLTFFAVGLMTLVVAGVVLAVVGSVVGLVGSLAAFLLFKVAPLMLIGWVVVKILDRRSASDRLSAADRRWLEGE